MASRNGSHRNRVSPEMVIPSPSDKEKISGNGSTKPYSSQRDVGSVSVSNRSFEMNPMDSQEDLSDCPDQDNSQQACELKCRELNWPEEANKREIPKRSLHSPWDLEEAQTCTGQNRKTIDRLVLLFVSFISLTSITLTLLLMSGKVGSTNCTACFEAATGGSVL